MTTPQFPTFEAILQKYGGIAALKRKYVKLCNEPFMPLVIDHLGDIPVGDIVSFSHTYEQNGDIMRDPEVTFLIQDGIWQPMSYQLDKLGIYQEVLVWAEGRLLKNPPQYASLCEFAKLWGSNLKAQGFLNQ